jgi:hypothetical protein
MHKLPMQPSLWHNWLLSGAMLLAIGQMYGRADRRENENVIQRQGLAEQYYEMLGGWVRVSPTKCNGWIDLEGNWIRAGRVPEWIILRDYAGLNMDFLSGDKAAFQNLGHVHMLTREDRPGLRDYLIYRRRVFAHFAAGIENRLILSFTENPIELEHEPKHPYRAAAYFKQVTDPEITSPFRIFEDIRIRRPTIESVIEEFLGESRSPRARKSRYAIAGRADCSRFFGKWEREFAGEPAGVWHDGGRRNTSFAPDTLMLGAAGDQIEWGADAGAITIRTTAAILRTAVDHPQMRQIILIHPGGHLVIHDDLKFPRAEWWVHRPPSSGRMVGTGWSRVFFGLYALHPSEN